MAMLARRFEDGMPGLLGQPGAMARRNDPSNALDMGAFY